MKSYISALSIAGSDPSGGAGIQADLKTFSALGVYGAAAITAVTVQNTMGVKYVHELPPQVVHDQIVAVMEDIHPDAVKIGMVNDASTLDAIISALTEFRPRFLVVDPVMVSSSGKMLMTSDALILLKERLLPMTDLLTPNIPEASVLSEEPSDEHFCVDSAARAILAYGTDAVLIRVVMLQVRQRRICFIAVLETISQLMNFQRLRLIAVIPTVRGVHFHRP